MAIRRFRKYGKKRRGGVRRTTRRATRKTYVPRRIRSTHHRFQRYGYSPAGNDLGFTLTSAGQFFWLLLCDRFVINY